MSELFMAFASCNPSCFLSHFSADHRALCCVTVGSSRAAAPHLGPARGSVCSWYPGDVPLPALLSKGAALGKGQENRKLGSRLV